MLGHQSHTGTHQQVIGHRGGGSKRHHRVQGAGVLIGQHVVARRWRGDATGGDVGVLGQIQRPEAASLGFNGQGGGMDGEVGGEDGETDAHGVVAPRCQFGPLTNRSGRLVATSRPMPSAKLTRERNPVPCSTLRSGMMAAMVASVGSNVGMSPVS